MLKMSKVPFYGKWCGHLTCDVGYACEKPLSFLPVSQYLGFLAGFLSEEEKWCGHLTCDVGYPCEEALPFSPSVEEEWSEHLTCDAGYTEMLAKVVIDLNEEGIEQLISAEESGQMYMKMFDEANEYGSSICELMDMWIGEIWKAAKQLPKLQKESTREILIPRALDDWRRSRACDSFSHSYDEMLGMFLKASVRICPGPDLGSIIKNKNGLWCFF